VASNLEEKPWSLEQVVEMTADLHAWEKLLAEVKPIFTFIAYGRVAKFPAKQTKHTDNSHEDRRHGFGYSRQLLGITRTIFPIGPNTNRYATMSAVTMFSRLCDV